MKPNPDQPGRCPSIDPHDTLQCTRSIHEDGQCRSDGIAWEKGAPRYVSPEELLTAEVAELRRERDEMSAWIEEHALVKTLERAERLDRIRALADEHAAPWWLRAALDD